MAVEVGSSRIALGHAGERGRPVGGLAFDWLMVGLSCWLMVGAFLDAWAHSHRFNTLESFFTPWHGVLYSGFLATSGAIVYAFYRNRTRGYHWRKAVPRGYELSLIAMFIFAFGGVGDMLWHTLFGIERNLEAALSPTHLTLAFGIVFFLTGPFRAAWHRREQSETRWAVQFPMLLSLSFALAIMTLLTEFAHPLVGIWANTATSQTGEMLGIASIMLQTALLMGWVLLIVRRWRLVPGALTFLFTLNALLLSILQYNWFLVPAVFLAGLCADALVQWLQPSAAQPRTLHIFAFVVPAIYYFFYFLDLMVVEQVAWTPHLWVGAIFLAGATGLGLSYLLVPPALPAGETH
jgi:hypothetical protein